MPPPHLDTLHSLIFSLLLWLGTRIKSSSSHVRREGRVFLFQHWPELTKNFRGCFDLHWPSVHLFWCGFGWRISVLAGRSFGQKKRGNLTSCLTNIDCTRAGCSIDFCWPVLTGLFQSVLGWLDLLLEAKVNWVWPSWIEEEICRVDQRWLFG